MAAAIIAGAFGYRVLIRRIQHAREPDPQSTLKI
jgi:hypothetical protein